MGFFRKHFPKDSAATSSNGDSSAPPAWAPAVERSLTFGLKNEAPEDEFAAAEQFCARNPPNAPKLLAYYDVDRIAEEGCKAWGLVVPQLARFRGSIADVRSDSKGAPKVIEVRTEDDCGDTCIVSNYPIMAGLYDIRGKEGVYFEVTVLKMGGVVAIGAYSHCTARKVGYT